MTRQTGKCWWREAACRKVGNWDLSHGLGQVQGEGESKILLS